MREALFYEKLDGNEVRCLLCPRFCRLKPGRTGSCKVRENVKGKLVTHVYNKIASLGTDPVEKKPLYHFYPGMEIFSVGEVGCNFHCSFCQNYRTSQCFAGDFRGFHAITASQIISKARRELQNIGIAYTYNEPFTFYEFMLDIAKLAKESGLKNVAVSNGYINPEPLRDLIPYMDAFNIDLKAFNNGFYKKYIHGKLQPVLETIKTVAKNGKHLEITNLVIPGLNDDERQFEEMVQWIADETGRDTPFHISRYFSNYKLNIPPTPVETLIKLYVIAGKYLDYVYLGNVSDERRSSTYCQNCGELLVERNLYRTRIVQKKFKGICTNCGSPVNMVF